jgi:drug/metabolite transporter (DMT)-like permease
VERTAQPARGFGALAITLLVLSITVQVGAFLFQRIAGLRTATGSAVSTWGDPYFFGSVAFLAVNGLVWPFVLRRIPLSRAYPFTAFIPPLNLVAAAFVLGEPVGGLHVLGMALVAVGVWILAGRER